MVEPFEVEEFWEDLLAFIEDRHVIPVVGAELLTIEDGSQSVPLYRAVAERLLSKYGFSGNTLPGGAVLRKNHELNDAVCALAAAKSKLRVRDLYRPINDILQKLIAEQREPLEPLRQLASIRDFDLFATTTADDLLARALNAMRFDGAQQTDQIEYAPKLPTERRRDIPELGLQSTARYSTSSARRTFLPSTPSMTKMPWNSLIPCKPATDRSECSPSCAAAICF